jgi:hypothetical protein
MVSNRIRALYIESLNSKILHVQTTLLKYNYYTTNNNERGRLCVCFKNNKSEKMERRNYVRVFEHICILILRLIEEKKS